VQKVPKGQKGHKVQKDRKGQLVQTLQFQDHKESLEQTELMVQRDLLE
jgi:hypothetical protein